MSTDTKRRNKGEGSIFQRPDGKWEAVLVVGHDPLTGRRLRRKRVVASKPKAVTALKALVREQHDGVVATSKRVTVGHWGIAWLENVEHRVSMGDLKASTAKNYETAWRVHLEPALGRVRVADLSLEQVNGFYAALLRKGSSAGTVNGIGAVLRMVVQHAVQAQVAGSNVVDLATLPKVDRDKTAPLAGADLKRLLAALTDPQAARWVELLSLTGLRIGELLALRWDDLDLDAGVPVLHMRRTATGRRAGITGPPKSKASTRDVPLSPRAVALLKAQRVAQGKDRLAHPLWQDTQTVFHSVDGDALPAPTAEGTFRRARAKAGLDDGVTPHSLRHGFIRGMLMRGVASVIVAKVSGHTPATLHAAYADVIDDDQGTAVAAAVLGALS